MITAILGLIAAITAALISRSVMISNHRQSWINALRDDLATFFSAIDRIQASDEQLTAENKARLTYRKILMRLNMNEPLHRELESMLTKLLPSGSRDQEHDALDRSVRLARIVLKHEWEVTKYGPFTPYVLQFKSWRKGQKDNPTREL